MAIITDPTYLLAGDLDTASTPGPELTIDTTARTIQINLGVGDLPNASDGVTFQALYSALKLLWKNSSVFIKLPFPAESITPEQFEIINGWSFANATTRKAIRTAGWAERNASGIITAMYAGIVSLGNLGAIDQPYYQQALGGAPTLFSQTGPVNEAVLIYSDTNGDGTPDVDYRGYMKLFAREPQKTYAQATLSDIGVSGMTYIVYRFPLGNADDLKVTVNDASIVSNSATYGGITITYYTTNQSRTIGGNTYNYRVIINGNFKPAERIYEKIQYLLRQNSDIDIGPADITGKTADSLIRFLGDSLITSTGVFIDNFDANDTNRITFTDITGTGRTFPFVAAGSIVFNSNLVNDPSAVYAMFYTTNPAGNFGGTTAVVVEDANGAPITGPIISASMPFSFNYDSNVQGGRTASTEAQVTVVAIGLTTGQYVAATGTIGRTIGQTIALTAALERNYINA
jgi:hypothetical protein